MRNKNYHRQSEQRKSHQSFKERRVQLKRRRVRLVAPKNFCFRKNPQEICEFFHKYRIASLAGNNLHISLASVSSISVGAIVMLIAHLKDEKFSEIDVNGDVPSDFAILRLLAHSGFFQHVKSPLRKVRPDAKLFKKFGRRVDQKSIMELIDFASRKIYGSPRPMRGVYRILVEAMANTHDHANQPEHEEESWWAIVGYDEERECVRFCLFDLGVGIFGSAKLRIIRDKIAVLFGVRKNFDVLKDILDGELESRTGISYRGKGLPAMKKAFLRNQIRGLTVAANDAFVRVEEEECILLSPPLNGTYISWEVDRHCN